MAMLGGAMLLLAGCPGKPPEQAPQAEPPAKIQPAAKAEEPKASAIPTLPPPAAQAPAKPEPPAPKATTPQLPKEPPAKTPTVQASPPTERMRSVKPVDEKAVLQPALKPVITIEKTASEPPPAPPRVVNAASAVSDREARPAPRVAAGAPIRSPQPKSEGPALRPVPLAVSPSYSSTGGWTARPNPLRGGQAPADRPGPEADSPPGKPAASLPGPAQSRPRPEMSAVAATTPSSPGTPAATSIEAGMGRGATKKTGFDPVKENGPIFVGWTKPRAALVITGRQEGYLEPCGCAGLDRMKGGASRRHTFLEQLRGQGWPIVCMDLGGLSKGFGRQAELKFQTTVEALKRMGYNAIGLGTTDLRLPGAELLSVAKGVGNQQSPFISANVGLFTFDPPMIDAYRVVEAGGMRIGVTAVLGTQEQNLVQNGDVLKEDPEKKLAEMLPKLKTEADYLVLLAFASIEEATVLSRRFPEFKVVVTAGGGPEPPAEPARIGKSLLVEVGEKGMNAIVVGLYDDAEHPWRYQRVPLDSRFKNSPEMRMLMESYQDQLKSLGFAGLGLRAVPHPQKKLLGNFVGSDKCESCHAESYRVWKKSGHSRAYQTLASLNPPRNFDPECVACHVIGWHPQECFPYEGGFASQETTPKLVNVGCESCHGPGGAHVAAEQSDDEKVQGTLRRAVQVTKEEAHQRMCTTCHDGDNSPDFKFETCFPDVEHHEKK